MSATNGEKKWKSQKHSRKRKRKKEEEAKEDGKEADATGADN